MKRRRKMGIIGPMLGITAGLAAGMFMTRNSDHTNNQNLDQNKTQDTDSEMEIENIAKSGSGQQSYL